MRLLIAGGLIFILFLSFFRELGIYFSFQLHQKYIAETLCVNKNRPNSLCNGKCFLMSQIKASRHKQEKEPLNFNPDPFPPVYTCEHHHDLFHPYSDYNAAITSQVKDPMHSSFYRFLFKPPEA